jgi:sugar lactone lactonase YvrE
VLGALLYFAFFRSTTVTPNGNGNGNGNIVLPNLNGNVNRPTGNTNGELPNVNSRNVNGTTANTNAGPDTIANGGNTKVQTLVTANAKDTVVDGKGNLRYYDSVTGLFYQLDANGNVVPLGTQKFPSAESVTWSPDRNQVIVSFPDDSKLYYDFNLKKQATLPKEGTNFSFAPTGTQIAFKFNATDPNNRYLVVSNPDGTDITPIESLGENGSKVQVSWSPNNQVIATYAPGLNGSEQEVYFVGKNGENFKSTVTAGRGFEGSWSPTGRQIVYSTYSADSNFNPVLHIVDAQGDSIGANNHSLDLQTWSDKCTFSQDGNQVYCAVPDPGQLPAGSGIYRDQATNVKDSFYVVDLTTGSKTKLAAPVGTDGSTNFSAVNLGLSPDQQTMYFTDAASGRVMSLRLR